MSTQELRDLGGGTSSGILASRASYAPDHPAVVFEGREITYRELDDAVSAVASALISLGLAPGDAVSVFMSNRPEFLIACSAIARAGLRYVPINTAFKATFLEYQLEHSDTRAIIAEKRLADPITDLRTLPSGVANVVYVDGRPDRLPQGAVATHDWDELIADSEPVAEFPLVRPGDISAISYTSGTTGRSKGALGPALQGVMMAREVAVAMDTTARDRLYTCLPLFHGAAMVATCLHAFYAGATVCMSTRFSASRFWDEVRECGATEFNALGSIIPMLLGQPPSPRDREHNVTRVFAAPAGPEVLYRFERRFGIHIVEGYGSTEIKNVMYNPRHGRKVGSMGIPTASSIVEIHDELGAQVPPGQVGEIVYRPRMANIMFAGYHRDPESTLAAMGDLWFHTGDLGFTDHDGFFYFADRKKDAMRRRGENISSQEVEAALTVFPGVIEAAAVAVPSDLGEDEILVIIEVSDPASVNFEGLFRHCDLMMPHFMVPRYYRVAPGLSLPRTPTGKLRKVTLREEGVTAKTWDAHAAGMRPSRNV